MTDGLILAAVSLISFVFGAVAANIRTNRKRAAFNRKLADAWAARIADIHGDGRTPL